MNMMAVSDIFIIHYSGGYAAESVAPLHMFKKGGFELLGISIDDSGGVLAEDFHLALVGFAHTVALEPVLVPALLLAHLEMLVY